MYDVYTDGSVRQPLNRLGWGVVICENQASQAKLLSGQNKGPRTSTEMELEAIIYAVRYLKKKDPYKKIKVHTDCQAIVQRFKGLFKSNKYKELWDSFLKEIKFLKDFKLVYLPKRKTNFWALTAHHLSRGETISPTPPLGWGVEHTTLHQSVL